VPDDHFFRSRGGQYFLGDQPSKKSGWKRSSLPMRVGLKIMSISKASLHLIYNHAVPAHRSTLEGLRRQKALASEMKNLLLLRKVRKFGELLHEAWEFKKKISPQISNLHIDDILGTARQAAPSEVSSQAQKAAVSWCSSVGTRWTSS